MSGRAVSAIGSLFLRADLRAFQLNAKRSGLPSPTISKALQKIFATSRQKQTPPKIIDDESNAAQSSSKSSPMSIEFGSRSCVELRGPQKKFWFKVLMHFGFYLMIAALVLVCLLFTRFISWLL